jgi:hypothetical protein
VGLAPWPAALVGLLGALMAEAHPLADHGWIAWPLVFAAASTFLRTRESQYPALHPALYVIAACRLIALLVRESHWQVAQIRGGASAVMLGPKLRGCALAAPGVVSADHGRGADRPSLGRRAVSARPARAGRLPTSDASDANWSGCPLDSRRNRCKASESSIGAP